MAASRSTSPGARRLKRRSDIATRALGEISGDFKFLSELSTEEIGCPTCGTEYNNDFAVRFAIATDEDRVATFITQIRGEIARLDTRISDVYAKFRLSHNQALTIQQILAEKQNEVSLEMIIESEGRKSVSGLLRTQLNSAEDDRNTVATKHSEAFDRLKDHRIKLANTEEAILAEYRDLLRRNLAELEVNEINLPKPERRFRPVQVSEKDVMCTCSQCAWAVHVTPDNLDAAHVAFGLHLCGEHPPYPVCC